MPLKKVLIFSFAYYPYIGGAEVAIKEITDRLGDIQFDLITFNLGAETPEEKIGNVSVHRVSASTKYLYPIKSFFKGVQLHRKNNYDIVWAMMANTGFAALFLKIIFPRINFVLTIQEGDPIEQIKRRVRFVYPIFKQIFKKADHVTAISNYLADFAKQMGAKEVDVVPNGVDLQKFRINETVTEVGPPMSRSDLGHKMILVTTGRLVKKNAIDDIIKSLKFLPDDVIFKSVGSGADEDSLRALVDELKLNKRVEFIAWADHNKIADLLHSSHIFVRPSLSEGLGNSFLEAMAVGLPIIGTNIGGIPDFLKEGETGLFCEVRNPEDIAKAVMTLIQDPDLYRKISQGGRKLVLENYDWDKIAERFGKIFTVNLNS